MMAVFAEFERAIIQERVCAGLAKARAQGKQLGRPKVPAVGRALDPCGASGWEGAAGDRPRAPRRLKRGSFHSLVDLQVAIHRYNAEHNDDPKPFSWTKTPRQILAKLNPLNAPVR
jgi:Resolvase, N terminal domain